jgi:hypothetical protein
MAYSLRTAAIAFRDQRLGQVIAHGPAAQSKRRCGKTNNGASRSRPGNMPCQWVTSEGRSAVPGCLWFRTGRHGVCSPGVRLSPMFPRPPHMKALLGRHLRCEKCGELLAATRTKKRTNGSLLTQGFRGIRMEYGQGKELGWALCVCGHETPLGRRKSRSTRL